MADTNDRVKQFAALISVTVSTKACATVKIESEKNLHYLPIIYLCVFIYLPAYLSACPSHYLTFIWYWYQVFSPSTKGRMESSFDSGIPVCQVES